MITTIMPVIVSNGAVLAEVNVSVKLAVTIKGAGAVYYKGNPGVFLYHCHKRFRTGINFFILFFLYFYGAFILDPHAG